MAKNTITAEELLIEKLQQGRTMRTIKGIYYLSGDYMGAKRIPVDRALAERVTGDNPNVQRLAGVWVWRDAADTRGRATPNKPRQGRTEATCVELYDALAVISCTLNLVDSYQKSAMDIIVAIDRLIGRDASIGKWKELHANKQEIKQALEQIGRGNALVP